MMIWLGALDRVMEEEEPCFCSSSMNGNHEEELKSPAVPFKLLSIFLCTLWGHLKIENCFHLARVSKCHLPLYRPEFMPLYCKKESHLQIQLQFPEDLTLGKLLVSNPWGKTQSAGGSTSFPYLLRKTAGTRRNRFTLV